MIESHTFSHYADHDVSALKSSYLEPILHHKCIHLAPIFIFSFNNLKPKHSIWLVATEVYFTFFLVSVSLFAEMSFNCRI